jgi:2-alkenal reductase
MNSKKYWAVTAGLGCLTLILLVAVIAIPVFVVPFQIRAALNSAAGEQVTSPPEPGSAGTALPAEGALAGQAASLSELYSQSNPGIVTIRVYAQRGMMGGQGSGSGFVYDDRGHIVTNNHVVASAQQVTVVFYNELEAEASVVGTDPDSDLAVIKVDGLPEDVHPLPLGDSNQVTVGETVIAIGNPFGLQSSMTAGIVSAVGRTIESGVTPFSIPHAIQTDAAINPGNSGGPLLNLKGEVIGVNAQIATSGAQANAGVGFAIPASIVRQVVPVLIEKGAYQWPWLGVSGRSVNLAIMRANGLDAQQGAYIDEVDPEGPAAKAGLQGSSGTRLIDSAQVPTGGDVIVAVDGKPAANFDALLVEVAAKRPGDQVALTVQRSGQQRALTVTLAARPSR